MAKKDPAPLDRKARRAAKKANRPARGARLKQLRQAYVVSRKADPKLPWIMLAAGIGAFAVVFVLGLLVLPWWVILPFAIAIGVFAALFVFGRRAQNSAFSQVEGQPGAAGWVLQGMRGDWRVSLGVAGTSQLDVVHRVLGRPGILLVAEGSPHRVKGLLAQEKKKVARVVGTIPIYDVVVGDGEGEVPLRKLNNHVLKLPRNITAGQVNTLEKRLAALGTARIPLPQGPAPRGAQMSVSQRALKRR